MEQWFANLLPANEAIVRRLQRRFSLRGTRAFEPLETVGRDCAGAVQLLPPEEEPTGLDRIEATPLTDAAIGHLHAHHPSVQAADGPGGQQPDRCLQLGGERVALRPDPGGLRPADGRQPTGQLWEGSAA